jgi:N-acetylneuraminic acid mutarotase
MNPLVHPRSAVYLLLMLTGTLPAFFRPQAPVKVCQRPLMFAERVSYQKAIEEVYWRHRIWPTQNPDPKPRLDKVMSQAQIEKKVEDYLRNSQALEDYWQRPITPDQLQAEMERIAGHTKQPQVLRELFVALGNDPFVIAECLARPVLAERLVTEANNEDSVNLTTIAWRKQPFAIMGYHSGNAAPAAMAAVSANYTLPTISSDFPDTCADDTWTATSLTNAPDARVDNTAVWTGSEMIVWGGSPDGNIHTFLNTGGRYNPSTDSWTATSTTGAPNGRSFHTAVWTGSEMIVWGGYNGSYLNTGGRYNPSTDSWAATSIINTPSARLHHTAVWTGSQMIVWGGQAQGPVYVNTGGRYNPSTDSWTATSTTGAPSARAFSTAVWTSSEMIAWGGFDGTNVNTGGRYNPGTDTWTATSLTNAPSGRVFHTAIWTGSEMIVWAGFDGTDVNTGARYDPNTDTWTATSTTNAPGARSDHTAVLDTGGEMIVWGGDVGASPVTFLNTGGRYNPSTDSWTATSTTGAPSARAFHTAVWTGSQMIVWGGYAGDDTFFNSGGRYCSQLALPRPTPTPRPRPTPAPRPIMQRVAARSI